MRYFLICFLLLSIEAYAYSYAVQKNSCTTALEKVDEKLRLELYEAVLDDDIEKARSLVDQIKNIHTQPPLPPSSQDPFLAAVRTGTVEMVTVLSKHSSIHINYVDHLLTNEERRHYLSPWAKVLRFVPLVEAMSNPREDAASIVWILLNHSDIDVNAQGTNTITPLRAAINSRNKEIVRLILERSELTLRHEHGLVNEPRLYLVHAVQTLNDKEITEMFLEHPQMNKREVRMALEVLKFEVKHKNKEIDKQVLDLLENYLGEGWFKRSLRKIF